MLAVFLISLALLGLEILFVRLISILFYAVSTYLVVSLALLGFGLSGTLLALRKKPGRDVSLKASRASVGFALATFAALFVIWFSGEEPAAALALPVILAIPFAFGGAVIALALSIPNVSVNRIYFADLIGAGVGAGLVFLLLPVLGGINLAILLGCIGLVVADLFASESRNLSKDTRTIFAAVLILGALVYPAPHTIVPVAPKELARMYRLDQPIEWEYQGWSALARVDVVTLPGDQVELPQAFEYKLVTQDGGAPSILLRISDLETADFTEHTIFGIPYWIKTAPKVLIIGLGGGPDVQTALREGASAITGVEVNNRMIEIVKTTFADYVRNIYDDPRVTILEGDGRHFARQTNEFFDIIQLTGVDTSVASLGGNPNLAENYLYTVEAFHDFYRRLTPDGTLSVSFPSVHGLGIRLMATGLTMLEEEEIRQPLDHMIVSETGGFVHVLIKKTPFSTSEIATIEAHFNDTMVGLYFPLYNRLFGFPAPEFFERHGVLYAPGLEAMGEYGVFVNALSNGNKDVFLANHSHTVFPSTDDWPFFFVLDKPGSDSPNLQILGLTLKLLVGAAFVFILAPLFLLQRRGLVLRGSFPLIFYFGSLGLGFIFIEVVLIQKLSLFLGHPSYSLAATLCTLLIASGLGSFVSGKKLNGASKAAARKWVMVAGGLIALITFLFTPGLSLLLNVLLPLPHWLRMVLAVLIVALPGFLMGIPFPVGLAAVKSRALAFVPWAWAINSTTTVIGTVLAVLLAMLYGFTWVFMIAGMLYTFIAILCFWVFRTYD